MRNTNSREKTSTSSYSQQQQSNNRLMKTQLPPKGSNKQSLNSTQYKLPPNAASIKRIQSTKSSSSSSNNQIPRQERNYDIQSNMTESKIITAKQSLQLLKKKMNRTAMSRQKPSSATSQSNQNIPVQQKTTYNSDSMKKIKSDSNKNIQSYQPTITNKYSSQSSKNYQQEQQSYSNKDMYEPQSYKAPLKKPVQQQQQQVQKPQMKKTTSISQNYYNEVQQVPIGTKKQSFQAMIQRQLRKQQQQGRGLSNNPSNNYQKNQPKVQLSEYPDDDGGQLFQCSKGCGRQFNANVLAKHEKICEKVFQSKRKVFNTAAQRQVQNQGGFQKPPEPVNKFNQTKKPAQKKASKIPKWKLQSAQLRAGLKALSNAPLTKQEEALTKMQSDNLVPCNYCGRKFNQTAAQRHIPVCANKAKQVNRAPVARKK